MNESHSRNNYTLEVANFGPIVKANVELRPLTVFLGPSNSGKSYLAILIYALHRGFNLKTSNFIRSPFRSREKSYFDESIFESESFTPASRKKINGWLARSTEISPLPMVPKEIALPIRSVLEKPEFVPLHLEEEIKRCYSVERLGELIRIPSSESKAKIKLSIPLKFSDAAFCYDLQMYKDRINLSGDIGSVDLLSDTLNHFKSSKIHTLPRTQRISMQDIQMGLFDDMDYQLLLHELSNEFFRYVLQPLFRNAYYLPASRTGIMHAQNVVVSTLIQNASTAGLRPSTYVPMLSGILTDYLDQLIHLHKIEPRNRRHRKHDIKLLATQMEANILKGEVLIKRLHEFGSSTFEFRPDGWKRKLPFTRVSSMVSELAPVVLYLRYLVNPGDTLIIEEPEAHLHPAMQAAFAKELAKIVRSGVRIIVTTHSEWFLEKIGNLTRLASLPKSRRSGIEEENVALDTNDVGAWLFKISNRPKGSMVEEIQLDPETGLFPSDYSDVSESLYNEGAKINNRLQDTSNEWAS